MVKIRDVRKSYNGIEVLKGVDLSVNRGEVTCLIGPSGSGKSTLLRCINHLEKHDSGELRVDDSLVTRCEMVDSTNSPTSASVRTGLASGWSFSDSISFNT